MQNGEVKRVVDANGQPTNRLVIQVADIGHVIDIPQGMEMDDVVAGFWNAYRAKQERDKRIIAANVLKRRKEAEEARKAVLAQVADVTDADIADLAAPKPIVGLRFEGLEPAEPPISATVKTSPIAGMAGLAAAG